MEVKEGKLAEDSGTKQKADKNIGKVDYLTSLQPSQGCNAQLQIIQSVNLAHAR